ncbi:MFS transporter [Streptomyces mirabilis]|uniref:MFS transporter n=1 Tax=Streptomyces mirabilis TaxID=68239 RepID=UPI0036366E71
MPVPVTPARPPVGDPPGQALPSPAPALAAAVLGFFVITLDALVVNVALPSIQDDLGGGVTGLQWVMDGYTLMFAALLLSSGALSDRIGASQAYAAGFAPTSAGVTWARRARRKCPSPVPPLPPVLPLCCSRAMRSSVAVP